MTQPKFWPGTSIPKSTGNCFDVRPGQRSIFASDPTFRVLSSGKTRAETATDTVAEFRVENGRCRGTIHGISHRSDKVLENKWQGSVSRAGR